MTHYNDFHVPAGPGLESVLEGFPAAALLAGPDLARHGATLCGRGDRWRWDGVEFEILHPPERFPLEGNDSSCVLRVGAAGHALLLTGDLEQAGERSLVAAGRELAADVVVVPHHGSATSSSAALTGAVGPRYALVSAAYANRWGFPKGEVVARWRQAGAEVLVTGEAGAIGISIDADGRVRLRTERRQWRRAWDFEPGR